MVDMINHPPHYTKGGIEAIDVIEAWDLDFCLGSVIKYICRLGRKGNRGTLAARLEDLRKAQWYMNRIVGELEKFENAAEQT